MLVRREEREEMAVTDAVRAKGGDEMTVTEVARAKGGEGRVRSDRCCWGEGRRGKS